MTPRKKLDIDARRCSKEVPIALPDGLASVARLFGLGVGLHVSLRSCVTGAWLRAVGGTTAALTRLANKRKPYVGRIAPISENETQKHETRQ
jgi:hypothetical protein